MYMISQKKLGRSLSRGAHEVRHSFYWLVQIHHLHRKGRKVAVRLIMWHQETRSGSPYAHADRPRASVLGEPSWEPFPLSIAVISPSPFL